MVILMVQDFGALLKYYRRAARLTQEALAEQAGYSVAYISKLERNERPALRATVEHLAQFLSLSPQNYERLIASTDQTTTVSSKPQNLWREDWGDALYVENFYGRERELDELEHRILDEHYRLVAMLGIGGVGKTALAVKLAERVAGKFDFVFWRSLQNAPSLDEILQNCIQFLSNQEQIELPSEVDKRILLLIQYLRDRRCLIVLDNFDAVLQSGHHAGSYRDGYESYGRLIRQVGQANHQSCLLLTSRAKPKEIAFLGGGRSLIQTLQLGGLDLAAGQELLEDKGVFGTDESYGTLIRLYSGNPLALQIISDPIRDMFGGDISEFLKEGEIVFGDIQDLLERQFAPLPEVEQEILFWLAIEREAVSLNDLHKDMVSPVPRGAVLEALDALLRLSLIESTGKALFILQPVVMEYLINKFIGRIDEELETETMHLFMKHALIKAEAKDYVRESQVRLILEPIARRLLVTIGKEGTESKCKRLLHTIHTKFAQQPGYAAGNVLNLLIHVKCDLRGYDFSHLIVWQSDLRDVALPELNFAYADLDRTVFMEVFDSVLAVAFSPDGEMVVGGTTNGDIRAWRAINGLPLRTYEGHTDWVYCVAFSPDGTRLVSGSDDLTVRLWDVHSGQLLKTIRGHSRRVRSVAFSPDGTVFASTGDDQTIRLWDAASGQLLNTLLGHNDRIWSVVFSPDGTMLASAGQDQVVRLWDATSGQPLKVFSGHKNWLRSVKFSPDGAKIVSCSDDQTIIIWDVQGGHILNTLVGHRNWVWSASFSPDGTRIASGSEDYTVRLWDAQSGQLLRIMLGHSGRVRTVTFSPDGTMLASGSEDQCVRLWDAKSGQLFRTLQGHSSRVRAVAFSPDGTALASGGDDQLIRFWDVKSRQILRILQGSSLRVWSVAFSPDGTMLASGSDDQMVRLWDVRTGQLTRTMHGYSHGRRVWSVAFSPDGTMLASGSDDQVARLWDVRTGGLLKTLERESSGWIWSVAFSPDGTMLASSSDDQTVQLWDIDTAQVLKIMQGHSGWVWSVAFSPDGAMLASSSDDQTVRLWDVHSGQLLKTLQGHGGWVRSVAFSRDGTMLASGSDDQTVRLWNAHTGELLITLQGHTNPVRSVAFSPDGFLASGSYDGTVKFWRIQTGECLATLRAERPYERMNITGATGLPEGQKTTLKLLGAFEDEIMTNSVRD
jgi:WD40 repeat protein/transcriptional regulator with XRE-family HTH domain